MVHGMELFAFNDTIRFGSRTQLPMVDSLLQCADTSLFLVKVKADNTVYFMFFVQQQTTGAWLKVAQTPVIAGEWVDSVGLDTIAEPFTRGPVITFVRSRWEESGVLTHYFPEKYWIYFKKWEYGVQ